MMAPRPYQSNLIEKKLWKSFKRELGFTKQLFPIAEHRATKVIYLYLLVQKT